MAHAKQSMKGKVAVVTGANSGIGLATAKGLAEQGAHVVALCRNPARGEAAVAEIKAATGSKTVDLVLCDLGNLASVRTAAAELQERFPKIHVLVNNAGVMMPERKETHDGFEATFGVNHLGPYLLTRLLVDTLQASAPARVVNVSSTMHHIGRVDFDDLDRTRRSYHGIAAYSDSKLANVLFSNELARRLEGTRVTSNAVHPGVIRSEINRDATGLAQKAVRMVRPLLASPEKGASTSLHVATSPKTQAVSGKYFASRRKAYASRSSRDTKAQRRLWDVSAKLVGLGA